MKKLGYSVIRRIKAPHDPDARISVKLGKARKLNYHCSMAFDTGRVVIRHIQTDFADERDSQYLPAMTEKVESRLKVNELRMTELLAWRLLQRLQL